MDNGWFAYIYKPSEDKYDTFQSITILFRSQNYLTTSYITHLKKKMSSTHSGMNVWSSLESSAASQPKSTVSSLWVNWQTIGLDALFFLVTASVTYR